jgi:hypothetical protein
MGLLNLTPPTVGQPNATETTSTSSTLLQRDPDVGERQPRRAEPREPYRENLNSMVNAARARGIGVQMTLLGTPTYAPSARTDAVSAYHADPQQFGQWAGQVSKTFAGRVRRYSMWNEPQSSTFLADRSASRYRKLFEAGAGAVRGNVHNAQILLGELMPGYSGDPKSVGHALPFMQRMLAAGKKPLVADGLAVHPYAWMGEQPDGTSRGPNALGADEREQGSPRRAVAAAGDPTRRAARGTSTPTAAACSSRPAATRDRSGCRSRPRPHPGPGRRDRAGR